MKLWRHAISVCLLVVMATSIGSATSSVEPKLSIDRMVEFFEIVVFGSDKGSPEAAFIRK
ncbi:MAG: hypothetical protein CL569_04080 [Alphaproteobacteria bacterium]|mgnify:CR=1 FL=1|nr:hypothetical protein [Alphaproteobacteria bacterium]|tara:strand:- start:368 stop:547 length:180 start_codon:yes stop_codon:yes gene_type:complete